MAVVPRVSRQARRGLSEISEIAAICRARHVVAMLGGRFALEFGIELERDPAEADRWALAATLLDRPPSTIAAVRTYRTLERAGVRTAADVRGRGRGELVSLLGAGGDARYGERIASRLLMLGEAIADRHGGRLATLGARVSDPRELEQALEALPGWGAANVHVFLRELRGVWPAAAVPLAAEAAVAARHLELPAEDSEFAPFAEATHLDPRDLEAALVRLSLAHDLDACPGGEECAFAAFDPEQLLHV